MKTTIDLPSEIVLAMKIKAARERKKLKVVAAELLREGLKPKSPLQESKPRKKAPTFGKHPKTGHPLVRVSTTGKTDNLSVQDSYSLIQEIQTAEDLEKLGRSL